ncbi:MAG: hypothetical protein F6K25_10605 [Okeania sp. SIO2G4]|uniref:hypothetical protein n=1 Tax=unclassified Okeania TaxID=2634635 RepID=UPI0013BA93C4|nr:MULTISPECIES: hypothetical protein [unclassified Okeania]NEP42772.1 hypothetical protein [Okeania sp. SIO2H7]NEP71981.1 hypothetical protein [Okeania sp. SIO2G5]NEP95201.1 hypothetical protein [Okeania sp. SIO2F5]NEQ91134.1 hypothetical protein [Okeania sp. SIO2G4]
MALVKRVYDINLNYLGVNPPLTPPRRGRTESGEKKEEERVVEGESFLFALLSGHDIISQITNAKKVSQPSLPVKQL